MPAQAILITPAKAQESSAVRAYDGALIQGQAMTAHPHYNERRFARVLAYLHQHYAQDIDLHRIAEVAALSPYHWHRIYRAVMHETIHATLKRIRLQRAAWLLGHSGKSVAEIAREVGYGGNAQSFARIFREHYGCTPEDYRTHSHRPYPERVQVRGGSYAVNIRTIAPIAVLALDHHGDYMNIGATFHRLYALLQLRGYPVTARSFGIYHDDPHGKNTEALYAQAAVETQAQSADAPLILSTIRGGRYAVLRHQGSYAELEHAYDWFYHDWLLAGGEQIADAPPFEEYLNDVHNTAPEDLLTDIYIPLAGE